MNMLRSYWLIARLDALWHWLRGHAVAWRYKPDPPICKGDIVCRTCNLVLWCPANDPWNKRRVRRFLANDGNGRAE